MRVLIAALALVVSVGFAQAEKRVALVIGNSSYKLISPLANPKNDARLMAVTLEDVGFEVVTAIDVDYRGMRRAVRKFGRALQSSGKDAVGLLYYAGHGVQSGGSNYLIPLNADIQSAADLEIESLSASNILAQMEEAGNGLNLVILDACRNNPFPAKVRAANRGLARIHAASGSLIAFAAAPGQVASDGNGENSPYTKALVEAIRQPGLPVEQVFKRARIGVESQTNGRQTPWEESSLRGDFYFVPKKIEPPVAQLPIRQTDKETVFWSSVQDSNDAVLLQTYLNRYPEGTFSELATTLINRLNAASANALKKQDAARRKEMEQQKKREAELKRRLEEERLAREAAERERLEAENREKEQLGKLAALTPPTTDTVLPQHQSPEEMAALGQRHETGDGMPLDLEQAAHWYGEAAAKGHAGATYRFGLLSYHGRGVRRNLTEAASRILDAVKLNHGPAVDALTRTNAYRDPAFVSAVQRRLKTLGFYRSRVDGKWGKNTRNAVLVLAGRELPAAPTAQKPVSSVKTKAPASSKKKTPARIKASAKLSCGRITLLSACVSAPQCYWVGNNHDRKCVPKNVVNSGASE